MRSENVSSDQTGGSFIEAARRAQIVKCAIETIATLGYGQASLAQIAKRAGISKGVISYHFADKDELIEQVVREVLGEFHAYMRPRIQAQRGAVMMLRTFIETNIAFMGARRDYLMVLVDILTHARRSDGKPLSNPAGYEAGVKEIEQILRRGQRSGEFREFAPHVMAVSIRQAIDGICPQLIADPQLDLDSYAKEVATIFDLATRKVGRRQRES
jgi:TetR/AcrR family transcriptional regulator, fatty acid metabolism regulator protein